MRFGYSEKCLAHDTGERHPESADRVLAIRRTLSRAHGVEFVDAGPVTIEEVEAVHDGDYVESFRDFCANGGGNWDPDTVASMETWDAALWSAGLARWAAVEAFEWSDGHDAPFALGRPPGHHAETADAGGFCFFNNVAVAAQHALDADMADRVAIVDWDVHHGNGTQDIFYGRGDVLFASIHEEGLYPGTGKIEETGDGEGERTTVNIPMQAKSGDAEYLAAITDVVAPVLDRYDPELVLVSAGFDAHRHDPISRMRVSTEGFGTLATEIRDVTDRLDAGLGFVLEGGYGLDTLADGIGMVHETFNGREPVGPEENANDAVVERLERIRAVQGLGSK